MRQVPAWPQDIKFGAAAVGQDLEVRLKMLLAPAQNVLFTLWLFHPHDTLATQRILSMSLKCTNPHPPNTATAIRSTIYRVTGLPIDKAENEIQSTLAETICNLLTEDEMKRAKVEITCIPSCDGSQTSSALVEFKGANPEFLTPLAHNPLGDWQAEMGDEDINFDRIKYIMDSPFCRVIGKLLSANGVALLNGLANSLLCSK